MKMYPVFPALGDVGLNTGILDLLGITSTGGFDFSGRY